MLTAIAVLSLIVVALGQILNITTVVWKRGQRESNNLEKARVMMDLFARDMQCIVLRSDLGAFPSGQFAFYTQRPGVSGNRDVSLVKYEINSSNILQRYDLAINWGDASDSISFGDSTTLPKLDQVKSRDAVSGVVCYRWLFLYADGTASTNYMASKINPLRSVALTMAVIDDQTLRQISPTQMSQLKSALDGVSLSAVTTSTKAVWEDYLLNSMDWKSYPTNFGSGLKIFERYVYVSTTYSP